MATKTSEREIRRFEGEFPLIIVTIGGRTIAGAQKAEFGPDWRNEWTVVTTVQADMPVLYARSEEDAVKWLHFLADLYEGKIK